MRSISQSVHNDTMLQNPDRMASLLIHPFGLSLFEEYKKMKETKDESDDSKKIDELASKLAAGLLQKENKEKKEETKSTWMLSEPMITKKIQEVLQANSTHASYTGEHGEHVTGTSSQGGDQLQGNPNIVERYYDSVEVEAPPANKEDTSGIKKKKNRKSLTRTFAPNDEEKENRKGIPVMITEASVDDNGGERKLAQAYEYARMQKDCPPNQVLMLVWLHFDRRDRGGSSPSLSVTQESWIFVGNQAEKQKARVGF